MSNNKFQRSRYWCRHSEVADSGDRVCSRGICNLPVLIDCCENCVGYEGKDRGLGDTIKRATNALGIKTCGKCQQRREALNKMTGKFYGAQDNGTD